MIGIIFTGGNSPSTDIIHKFIDKISGKYLIAAADSGLDTAENAGIKPDWIIGDMDSIKDLRRLESYQKEQVLRYPKDKDFTDTELAFSLLREKSCEEIWIIGGSGGRIDHLFGIHSMCEREHFPARWITDTADIYCVEACLTEEQQLVSPGLNANAGTGSASILNLQLGENALVSVFPLGSGPWKVLSKGLKWKLDDQKWERGFIGLSNTTLDKEVSLNIKQGRFMVIVPHSVHKE